MRQMIKKAAVVLSVVMVCAPLGAMAANKLIVKGTDGTTDKMVVTDTGNIGIGTNTPLYPISITGAGTTATTTLEFYNQGNPVTLTSIDSPGIQLMRNNNASATGGNGSTTPRHLDRLGNFAFGSYLGGQPKYSAYISSYAQGTWSNTSYPATLSFQTTSATDVYPQERMRIQSAGNVGIGTGNPQQKLEVNGGIRLSTTTGKPATCNATVRGTIWFTQGSAGVADTFEVCAKDATDVYAWKTLF